MKRLPLMDLAQFVAALLVILIHCGRLVENEVLHFVLKSLLARIAVPLFLVINGYFYREKQKRILATPKDIFGDSCKSISYGACFICLTGGKFFRNKKFLFLVPCSFHRCVTIFG